MKVGDLVRVSSTCARDDNAIGIITYLWTRRPTPTIRRCVSVLFEDGEYDVDSDALEVISESR